ncbi:hypothetical protein HKX48_006653 [Thoreauomyces humboldtii]|nr:hypothetical protein HKX48_006653 [Thoreauomyces humboldtii]
MTRDKRKKRKDHAAKSAVSKSHKANKQAQKAHRKDQKQNGEDSEEDIELLLRQFEELDRSRIKAPTAEEPCPPPSPRANASFVPSPLNAAHCFLFGGEECTGPKLKVYNDLFRYRIDKKDWRSITCALQPGPRSGHQVVPLTSGKLVLFGGEYASATQSQFHHWKDTWIFDIKTSLWEKLDIPSPAARSGHRMTVWKHLVVLYGGFYDNYKTTKYYDDLWVFDTIEYKWTKLETSSVSSRPSGRSGFQWFTHGDTCYMYGGYCKEKLEGEREKGIVFSDMWALTMSLDMSNLRWERVKKSNSAPPPRAGCSMTVHKSRAVLFGGVEDDEEGDESVCQSDMYSITLDARKWFSFNVKAPPPPPSPSPSPSTTVPVMPSIGEPGGTFDPSRPHPRYNAMLAVQKNTMLLYGGLFEDRKVEHTLDDLWCINLDKQGPWECLLPGSWERSSTTTTTTEAKPVGDGGDGEQGSDSGSDTDSSDSDDSD